MLKSGVGFPFWVTVLHNFRGLVESILNTWAVITRKFKLFIGVGFVDQPCWSARPCLTIILSRQDKPRMMGTGESL